MKKIAVLGPNPAWQKTLFFKNFIVILIRFINDFLERIFEIISHCILVQWLLMAFFNYLFII